MAAETTYRVHGGLHHNGKFYKHGSTVPASLFGSNEHVDDELKELVHAGTLKTEAEFATPTQLQTTLDEKDTEIERLRAQLAELESLKAEMSAKVPDAKTAAADAKADAKAEAKADAADQKAMAQEEADEKRDAAMEEARFGGPSEAGSDEQFPKSVL